MKIVQKRFGSSVAFEVVDGNLVVASKSFGTHGKAKIPLAFIADEYSEHQERSKGWVLMAVFCGLLSVACAIASIFVEKEARGAPLGLAIMFGVIAVLSVRSHVLRNLDSILFVRTDTDSIILMHRDNPTRDEFDAFVNHLVQAIREQKKSPNQPPEPTPTAVTPPAGQEARQP